MNLHVLTVALVITLLFVPFVAFAQSGQEYQILKSDKSETFAFPSFAANMDADSPLTYTYDTPKGPSWIFTITNNLTYAAGEDSRTIIRLQEPAPSEKYIEIAMYGGEAMKFWVAVNLPEAGYARLYSQEISGWSRDTSITLSHVSTSGLSVSDGRRTVVDRFDTDGFSLASVAVYGKDDPLDPDNAVGGIITFDILFGSFEDSPIFLVPALVTAGIGGVVIALLVMKKRRPSD